ncbi:hypothetical protein PTKIN_Ptkin10aG0190500 [Pterospermum kingtungense]
MEIIASKTLRKTDIGTRLALPSKSLGFFPPPSGNEHTVDFDVRDESDVVWKFRLWTRNLETMKTLYPKPVLTTGWRKFVCSRELRVGDRVVFYRETEQAGGVNYHVKVEKAVRIFGAVIAPQQDNVEEP